MPKAKQVLFTDEELSEETKPTNIEVLNSEDEEIEKMFDFEPIHVEEVIKETTMVDVIPVRTFSCVYGGTRYFFTKGKKQKVSIDVRDFLLRNKKDPKIKDTWG